MTLSRRAVIRRGRVGLCLLAKRTDALGRMGTKKTAKKAPAKKAVKKTAKAEPGPKLLSGGNPQIPKGDGPGPVKAYLDAMPAWKGKVGKQLDALVVRTVPGVKKAVRWNSPFYGVDGNSWFLTFHCMTKYIKVSFLNGGKLKPLPPVESKLPDVRYYHIAEGEKIDEALLSKWIKQAAKLPGDRLFVLDSE